MAMGAVRHVSDIRADDMDKGGAGVIGLQMGSNKGASQKGMAMGASRKVADMKVPCNCDVIMILFALSSYSHAHAVASYANHQCPSF